MGLAAAFMLCGVVTEFAVLGVLIYRRTWRTLPVFFAYCVWALLSDSMALGIIVYAPGAYNVRFYFAVTVIDFGFQLSVLIELAWSVLRPLRGRLSRRAILVLAALILGAGAAIWPFTGFAGSGFTDGIWLRMFQMQQTASILRILFFLGLAGCSHLLSLSWRDRELQVATGFGFYSLMSMGVAVVNSHLTDAVQITYLGYLVSISFLGSLIYWVFSFAHQEEARREFTPQMKQTLMALAATAHISRIVLADHLATEPQGTDIS